VSSNEAVVSLFVNAAPLAGSVKTRRSPYTPHSGLLAAQRRKLLTVSERKSALEMLSGLHVRIDEDSGHAAFHKTSTLAEKYGLSVYDAAYLEMALRRKLPLGSRDRALRSAAKRSGVKVL
jgi:predicted nucleic acid-binding protein